jgi:hypothetical protein
MRIDNQDIVRAARKLRDEENGQLRVRPWSRQHHFHTPAWLVAIPAAVFVGFVLGLWTHAYKQDKTPLTALVDTVYIEVPTSEKPQQEPAPQPVPAVSFPAPKRAVRPSAPHPRPQQAVGTPVTNDHIRYDLLVRN